MRIAVDLDQVVYDWEGTARYLLRVYRGRSMRESTDWNSIPHSIPSEDWEWLWTKGVELGMYRHGNLIKGSIDSLREIAKKHDVMLVTHRQRQGIVDTLKWISLHFDGIPLAGVHLLTEEEPKSSVGADILIDDRPENIYEFEEKGGDGILFSFPWNADVKHFPRANDWAEVRGIIASYERRHASYDTPDWPPYGG